MTNRVKWLAASAAVVLAAGPAVANHSWSTYHWDIKSAPKTFDVETILDRPHWDTFVDSSLARWDNPGSAANLNGKTPSKDYIDIGAVTKSTASARKCDPVNGKIVVCSDSYGYRGWLGIATVWSSGGHIVQGTTKLNNSYHDSGTYSSAAWRELVACQEIGHDFGLGHQNEDFNTDATDSCMEYTSDPTNNRGPDFHDFEQLQTIYDAHLAEGGGGGDTGGGGGCNPKSPKCNPAQDAFTFRQVGQQTASARSGGRSTDWGEAVGYDAHGRPNVFVQEVRQGFRKITHVTWVPGFRPDSRHMHDEH